MKLSTFITTAFIITLFISSCGKQGIKCEFANCPINSYCIDGDCVCEAGYEGDNCNLLRRDKILGTYKGTMKTKYLYANAPEEEIIETNITIMITENGRKDIFIESDFYPQPISCEVTYSPNSFNSVQTGEDGELLYQLNVKIDNDKISYTERKPYNVSRSFEGIKQ